MEPSPPGVSICFALIIGVESGKPSAERSPMPQKLIQGDKMPALTLHLADGGDMSLPEQLPGRYLALLAYRGNWCPYCVRHLKTYQAKLADLTALGISVIAATGDTRESTLAMAAKEGIAFPVAYGLTEADTAPFDAWWTTDAAHGHYVQPMELLVLRGGTVFGAMYASGPIGRMDVDEVLTSVRGRERRRIEQEQKAAEAARSAS